MSNRIVFITGASAGIGEATARIFAANQYDIIISGRRLERLEELKQKLENEYKVEVLPACFDIRDRSAVLDAVSRLDDRWRNVDVLINNAGLALGLSSVDEGELDDWDTMIDTNLKGLLYISRAISNIMAKRGLGHIINIGSIAGKEAYPNGNVYCATKHAVDGLTKAMRLDLFNKGIRVSQVAPGAVETEFSLVRFKGDKQTADNIYKGYTPLAADDIARSVYFVASQPQHVNINDLLIMPTAQANASTFNKES